MRPFWTLKKVFNDPTSRGIAIHSGFIGLKGIFMSKFCEMCSDGSGHCVYPYYGVAPHTCYYKLGTSIGTSQEAPESEWPENFVYDYSEGPANPGGSPGCGIYTHCLHCGAGT